ncbi:response regulator transcription factor [Roseateles sp. UC29_93]|uniref:response regulator transcription factor n=1 Tax=Roseateles sp. UC29_93 TaxID=3350177 RepID=UPI0036731137
MDVLVAMSTGASNKDISQRLGITGATVKTHVRAILSKVGAGARTEAVAIAARSGLTARPPQESALLAQADPTARTAAAQTAAQTARTAFAEAARAGSLRRAEGAGLDPGVDQFPELSLRPRRRLALRAGHPRPADQRVVRHVLVDLRQRALAVARGILDLLADLAERQVLPGHLARRDVPHRMTGHAGRVVVLRLVAARAAQRRHALAVRTTRDVGACSRVCTP